MEGDTPLHSAARLSTEEGAEEEAEAIITMLLEAGADPRYSPDDQNANPRIRNKGQLKAVDIVPAQHQRIKSILGRAELAQTMGGDVANGLIVCDFADFR
jgi:hypothetical protein